jgi:hypothetical protein
MQYVWGVYAFEDKQIKQVKDKPPDGGDVPASKSEDKGQAWSIF